MVELGNLAEVINSLHSFDFASFGDAKYELVCDDIKITLDRLSLCFYSHTLSYDVYSILSKNLSELFEKTHTREDIKERKEYTSLLQFFESRGITRGATIKKEERPDFVIKLDGTKFGVEVTSLSSEEDNQLHNIAKKYFGKGLQVKELKDEAYKKYKESSRKFDYYEIDGSVCIGRNLFNTADDKCKFASTIIKKYHKYKNEFEKFDQFVVLCDALETIAVTDEYDAMDVVEIAMAEETQMRGFVVAIMYVNDEGNVVVYQKEL